MSYYMQLLTAVCSMQHTMQSCVSMHDLMILAFHPNVTRQKDHLSKALPVMKEGGVNQFAENIKIYIFGTTLRCTSSKNI